jgi:hypothetical protein
MLAIVCAKVIRLLRLGFKFPKLRHLLLFKAILLYDQHVCKSLLLKSFDKIIIGFKENIHSGGLACHKVLDNQKGQTHVLTFTKKVWNLKSEYNEVGGIFTDNDPAKFLALIVEHELTHVYYTLLKLPNGREHSPEWYRLIAEFFDHCTCYVSTPKTAIYESRKTWI